MSPCGPITSGKNTVARGCFPIMKGHGEDLHTAPYRVSLVEWQLLSEWQGASVKEEKESEQLWTRRDFGSGAQICGRCSNGGRVLIPTTGAIYEVLTPGQAPDDRLWHTLGNSFSEAEANPRWVGVGYKYSICKVLLWGTSTGKVTLGGNLSKLYGPAMNTLKCGFVNFVSTRPGTCPFIEQRF